MNALNTNDIKYVPNESKRLSKHVVVNYLKPYVGEIYSENNIVKFVSDSGCVTGDLVTWVKNHIGEEYLSEYRGETFVKVTFPSDCKIEKGDTFECLTKSPFLVNDKVKFNIKICKKTGKEEIDMSNYDPKARKLIESISQ